VLAAIIHLFICAPRITYYRSVLLERARGSSLLPVVRVISRCSSHRVIILGTRAQLRSPQGRRKIERIDRAGAGSRGSVISAAITRASQFCDDAHCAMFFPLRAYCARPIICALRARNGGIGLSARLTIQEISVSRQELIPLITCNSRGIGVGDGDAPSRTRYKTLRVYLTLIISRPR